MDGSPERHVLVCLLINQIADFFLLLAGCIVYSLFSTTEFAVVNSLLEITPPAATLFGYTGYPLAHVSNLLFVEYLARWLPLVSTQNIHVL